MHTYIHKYICLYVRCCAKCLICSKIVYVFVLFIVVGTFTGDSRKRKCLYNEVPHTEH